MVRQRSTVSTGKKGKAVQAVRENDRIQVRLPLDMKAELEQAARADDRDVSYWVRRAIKEALDRRRKV